MLSSSRAIRLFVFFSLLVSFVQAHDVHLQSRDHASLQRMLKKRTPQDRSILGPITASASDDPDDPAQDTNPGAGTGSDTTTTNNNGTDTTTTTPTIPTNTTLTDTKGSNSTTSANSTTSTTSTQSKTTSTPLPDSDTLNLVPQPGTTTITTGATTKTASVDAPAASNTISADRQGASSASDNKSMTLTILIIVAASVGGVAIIWTIFRKWKLSSSKKFDQRLNPDWRPPTTDLDDSPLPTHRRRTSASSSHSGHGPSNNGNNLDQDLTAGPAHLTPVGGYADLARGPSPNPQMQERHMRGFDRAVPLHHQGGGYGNTGPFDAYDYNGQGVRY